MIVNSTVVPPGVNRVTFTKRVGGGGIASLLNLLIKSLKIINANHIFTFKTCNVRKVRTAVTKSNYELLIYLYILRYSEYIFMKILQ